MWYIVMVVLSLPHTPAWHILRSHTNWNTREACEAAIPQKLEGLTDVTAGYCVFKPL